MNPTNNSYNKDPYHNRPKCTSNQPSYSPVTTKVPHSQDPANNFDFLNNRASVMMDLDRHHSNSQHHQQILQSQTDLSDPISTGDGDKKSKSLPGFVCKLFKMVNDATTNLIVWSENGASFIVTNTENFAKEILPCYCKHNNFSSFVRQLNMYGFHKISHLQGGLVGEEADIWEFSNSNFIRGRPDLLVNIKRKLPKLINHISTIPISNSSPISNPSHKYPIEMEKSNFITGAITGNNSTNVISSNNLSTNENLVSLLVDFQHVLADVSSIKKQQEAIYNELKNIQRDNQILWDETCVTRERYKQQQDTINKILHFLASVFSHSPSIINNIIDIDNINNTNNNPINTSSTTVGIKNSFTINRPNAVESDLVKRKLLLSATPNDIYEGATETAPQKLANHIDESELFDLLRPVLTESPIYSNKHTSAFGAKRNSFDLNNTECPLPGGDVVDLTGRSDSLAHDIDLLQDNLNILTDSLGIAAKDLDLLAIPDDEIEYWKQNAHRPTPFDRKNQFIQRSQTSPSAPFHTNFSSNSAEPDSTLQEDDISDDSLVDFNQLLTENRIE